MGQITDNHIINYRKKLGGFINIHQLKEVYVIDRNRFAQIEPYSYTNTKISKR